MSRVVLDTSVLASAFFTEHGTSAELLRRLRDERVEIALSPAILEETACVLRTSRYRKRHPYSDDAIRRYLRGLSRLAVFVDPRPLSGVVRDPTDDVILATAFAASRSLLQELRRPSRVQYPDRRARCRGVGGVGECRWTRVISRSSKRSRGSAG